MTTSFSMQFLVSSSQANLMAINAIAQGILNAAERMAVLNIETSRAAAEHAASRMRMVQSSDWPSMMSLEDGGLRSTTEATAAYFRRVQDISSAVQDEVAHVLSARTGVATDAMVAVLDDVERSSPASVVAVAATVKSAVTNARSAYDSMLKTGRQAVEATTASVANAAAAIATPAPLAKVRKAA